MRDIDAWDCRVAQRVRQAEPEAEAAVKVLRTLVSA